MSTVYPTSLKRKPPYITVSAKGISNGLSSIPNDGADFGPDTLLNATAPHQYGPPYTQTFGIQEAANYLNNLGGGTILLGRGTYQIMPVSLPASVSLVGEIPESHDGGAPWVVTIEPAPGFPSNDNLITLSRDSSVQNINFDITTAINDIIYSSYAQSLIENCTFQPYMNAQNSIEFVPGLTRIIGNFFGSAAKNAHIRILANGNDFWIKNNFISQEGTSPANTSLIGIEIIGSQAGIGIIKANDITGMGYGLVFDGGGTKNYIRISDNNFDSSYKYGLYINDSEALNNVTVINNAFEYSGINHVYLSSTSAGYLQFNNFRFIANDFIFSSQHGVVINAYSSSDTIYTGGSAGLVFEGNVFDNSGSSASNTYSNVYLSGSISSSASIIFRNNWNGGAVWENGTSYTKYAYSVANLTEGKIVIDNDIIGVGTLLSGVVDNWANILYFKAIYANGTPVPVPVSTPAVPSSGTAQQNTNPIPVEVALYGGTVTQITITRAGTAYTVFSNSSGAALSGQVYRLEPGDSITLTYSSAPSWTWLPV